MPPPSKPQAAGGSAAARAREPHGRGGKPGVGATASVSKPQGLREQNAALSAQVHDAAEKLAEQCAATEAAQSALGLEKARADEAEVLLRETTERERQVSLLAASAGLASVERSEWNQLEASWPGENGLSLEAAAASVDAMATTTHAQGVSVRQA